MVQRESHYLRRVLAQNIRDARKQKGYSQEKLADEAGLHRTFIGSVERCERNISIDNVSKIALALKIEASDLLIERKG